MRYIDDVEIGNEESLTATYEVSAEEIIEMGKRWDPQPFHTDPVAAKDSFFGGLVAASLPFRYAESRQSPSNRYVFAMPSIQRRTSGFNNSGQSVSRILCTFIGSYRPILLFA